MATPTLAHHSRPLEQPDVPFDRASAAMIKGGDANGTDEFIPRQAWLYVSVMAGAYFISRGLAKGGSRDPYWDGASNHSTGNGNDHREDSAREVATSR